MGGRHYQEVQRKYNIQFYEAVAAFDDRNGCEGQEQFLKFIASDRGKMWVKQQQQILIPASQPVPQQLPANNP